MLKPAKFKEIFSKSVNSISNELRISNTKFLLNFLLAIRTTEIKE